MDGDHCLNITTIITSSMKALKNFGICISIAGYALIALLLVMMMIIFNHFGYLPHYGEPDPSSTCTIGITLIFAYVWLILHLIVALQLLYLLIKLFVKALPYKNVLVSFISIAVLLLLFRFTQLYYFLVWAFD